MKKNGLFGPYTVVYLYICTEHAQNLSQKRVLTTQENCYCLWLKNILDFLFKK
jgi:hypothetical protein